MNQNSLTQILAFQHLSFEADYDQVKVLADQVLEDLEGLNIFIQWLCVIMELRTRRLLGVDPEKENLNHYEHELTRIRFLDDLIEELKELKR